MKKSVLLMIVVLSIVCVNGCTRIVKLEPAFGPPGTPVFVKSSGLWGEPGGYHIEWDGKNICDPFSGSFTVPTNAKPGKHTVMLVDKVDLSEAALIFPLARIRHGAATFEVIDMIPTMNGNYDSE